MALKKVKKVVTVSTKERKKKEFLNSELALYSTGIIRLRSKAIEALKAKAGDKIGILIDGEETNGIYSAVSNVYLYIDKSKGAINTLSATGDFHSKGAYQGLSVLSANPAPTKGTNLVFNVSETPVSTTVLTEIAEALEVTTEDLGIVLEVSFKAIEENSLTVKDEAATDSASTSPEALEEDNLTAQEGDNNDSDSSDASDDDDIL